MSRGTLDSGRSNQKLRTRQDLLSAARGLMERGETLTIDRVAELARVSRATVYRYFPNVKAMLAEVPLDAAVQTPDQVFPDAEGTAEDRVVRAVNYVFDYAAENESSFRTFLSAVLEEGQRIGEDSGASLRGGRREGLLKRALQGCAPGLASSRRRRLITALSLMTGIEALMVTRDVLGREAREGRAAAEWAARVLVREALEPRED
jgi:AcrR family transcriptional regulator